MTQADRVHSTPRTSTPHHARTGPTPTAHSRRHAPGRPERRSGQIPYSLETSGRGQGFVADRSTRFIDRALVRP
jgi:hypothetical protein